jgi:hypothetical protein
MTKSREWFQDESLSDEELLLRCNKQFRDGPVGLWSTFGDDLTMFSGMTVVFAADGQGTVYCWSYEVDESHESKNKFRWKCCSDYEIELEPVKATNPGDRWGRIRYRFHIDRCPYNTRQVNITEIDPPNPFSPEGDFWWAASPLKLMSLQTDFDKLPGEDV